MHPLISIITTTYNAGKLLEYTICSIKEQTYSNIEYIIIDGNSTDNTLSIIKNNSSIINKIISENDSGIYDAMNKGLDLATGDFVIFMGAGDVFYSKYTVEKVVNKIKNFDSVYYGDVNLGKNKKRYWGKFNKTKICITNICHQSIFYPKIIYKNYRYSNKYKVYADYHLNLVLYNKFKFQYLNEIITFYNIEGYSSYTKDPNFIKDEKRIILDEYGYIIFIISRIYRTLIKIKKCLRKL